MVRWRYVLGKELCLPAIATKDEIVPLTRGRVFQRRAGCALHPDRQTLASLLARKAASPYVFAGQFQQDPVSEIGNLIETAWLRTFDPAALDLAQGQIVMSLDTASKDNLFDDYTAPAGLLIGKQAGIFSAVWFAVKFGLAIKLNGASWLQIYAVALMCGIGFTMSLFIGALAFPGNQELIEEAKIGVLCGRFCRQYWVLRSFA